MRKAGRGDWFWWEMGRGGSQFLFLSPLPPLPSYILQYSLRGRSDHTLHLDLMQTSSDRSQTIQKVGLWQGWLILGVTCSSAFSWCLFPRVQYSHTENVSTLLRHDFLKYPCSRNCWHLPHNIRTPLLSVHWQNMNSETNPHQGIDGYIEDNMGPISEWFGFKAELWGENIWK